MTQIGDKPEASPEAPAPIVVSAHAGAIDGGLAAFRLLIVVLGSIPLLFKMLGERDFIGVLMFLQSQDGVAWAASISALAAIVFGLLKTFKRGAQIATVAADERVPESLATTNERN